MSKFDELRKGDYLMSNNHEWKAVFQVTYTFKCLILSPKSQSHSHEQQHLKSLTTLK